MENIPYSGVDDFNPFRLTAGSKLNERAGGQLELDVRQGTLGLFTEEWLWILEKGREQTKCLAVGKV